MTTHAFSTTGFPSVNALQAAVGETYHLGLSAAVGAGGAPINYGYILDPDTSRSGGFHWRTDTSTKEALIQYSSPNLIDRDLAYFPRVSQGDFSGGGYQEVYIDPRRYFDSDLDVRVPGFLTLRQSWTENTATLAGATNPQITVWHGAFYQTYGEANGNVYNLNFATSGAPVAASVTSLFSDGNYLYAGTAANNLWRTNDPTLAVWTQITNGINGTADRWWVVNQGTNGYFAYYATTAFPALLYKVDLTTAFPIAPGAQPQVPTGTNGIRIIDICPYQSGIAILTQDSPSSANNVLGSDVWYHDGTNMTRIARLEAYRGQGICNALGNLYIGADSLLLNTSPQLFEITSGSISVVAIPGTPLPVTGGPATSSLGPISNSRYVYWPIENASINGISAPGSSTSGYVVQYDAMTGAVSHLPEKNNNEFTRQNPITSINIRQVAAIGDCIAIAYRSTANPNCHIMTQPTGAGITFQSTGWLFTSHLDFGTPGIVKRFRRVEIHHVPLNAGESITVKGWVDNLDPLSLTTASAPVPTGATVTNNTVGSTLTAMTFGQDTVGKTLTLALQLNAGTSNLTTPRVNWYSVETGGTWTAELYLACTAKRQLLTQEFDDQGATAADLKYLLFLAYEQGALVTLCHPNGTQYTMAIESYEDWNPSPLKTKQSRPVDEEAIVHVVLRQVA